MTCPICNDSYIIAVSGPDYFGNVDYDDCPCQTDPDFDPVDYADWNDRR